MPRGFPVGFRLTLDDGIRSLVLSGHSRGYEDIPGPLSDPRVPAEECDRTYVRCQGDLRWESDIIVLDSEDWTNAELWERADQARRATPAWIAGEPITEGTVDENGSLVLKIENIANLSPQLARANVRRLHGSHFDVRIKLPGRESERARYIDIWRPNGAAPPAVKCGIYHDLREWTEPWSFADYTQACGACANEFRAEPVFRPNEYAEELPDVVDFTLIEPTLDLTLGAFLAQQNERLDQITETARRRLAEKQGTSRALATSFTFPEPVRAACSQYLAYFGQFLADIGIDAETTVAQEAHRVLFTVRLRDSRHALTVVRDALNAFLSLPEESSLGLAVGDSSNVALQQLVANVLHLQSQVVLARAVIQSKDVTIARYEQIAAFARAGVLAVVPVANAQLSSSTSVAPETPEPVIGRLVDVGPVQAGPLRFNLGELLRILKRRA